MCTSGTTCQYGCKPGVPCTPLVRTVDDFSGHHFHTAMNTLRRGAIRHSGATTPLLVIVILMLVVMSTYVISNLRGSLYGVEQDLSRYLRFIHNEPYIVFVTSPLPRQQHHDMENVKASAGRAKASLDVAKKHNAKLVLQLKAMSAKLRSHRKDTTAKVRYTSNASSLMSTSCLMQVKKAVDRQTVALNAANSRMLVDTRKELQEKQAKAVRSEAQKAVSVSRIKVRRMKSWVRNTQYI